MFFRSVISSFSLFWRPFSKSIPSNFYMQSYIMSYFFSRPMILSSSLFLKRRCPPRVRKALISPLFSQFLSVKGKTPMYLAASDIEKIFLSIVIVRLPAQPTSPALSILPAQANLWGRVSLCHPRKHSGNTCNNSHRDRPSGH